MTLDTIRKHGGSRFQMTAAGFLPPLCGGGRAGEDTLLLRAALALLFVFLPRAELLETRAQDNLGAAWLKFKEVYSCFSKLETRNACSKQRENDHQEYPIPSQISHFMPILSSRLWIMRII